MNAHQTQFLEVFRDASRGNVKTPQSEFLEWGEVPVVDQGQDLIAGYVNDRSRVCNVDLPVIVFGDHTRVFKYVDFEFAMGADGTKILAPIRGDDPKYLFHALRALHLPAAGYSRHYKFLKRTEIPLPPLAEQKRIAKILDAADALRAKRRESLALLDELLRSTFLDMFGDPRLNPSDWPTPTLREVIRVKSGNALASKNMAHGGPFPVFGGNGISGYHDEYMFEEPRVVLGRVGVYCGAVHLTPPRAWVTDNALYVDALLQPIETTYLVHALAAANLNQYANRAAQPLISGGRIYPTRIMMPPVELQRRFADAIASIQKLQVQSRNHLSELDNLFASLQSRAFRGEL